MVMGATATEQPQVATPSESVQEQPVAQEPLVTGAIEGTGTPSPEAVAAPTPVETPVAPTEPEVPPHVAAQLQELLQREAYSQQIAQQAQAQLQQVQMTQESQQALSVLKQRIEQGELTAEQLAETLINGGVASYQQVQQAKQTLKTAFANFPVAIELAIKYHIPPSNAGILMQYGSRQAMEQAAKALTSVTGQAAELTAAKAEIARLKKASVPPQPFAGATPATPGVKTLQDLSKVDLRGKTPSELSAYEAEWDAAMRRARRV